MEREYWLEVSQALCEVAGTFKESRRFSHCTALIARVYLWAAFCHRSISWACEKDNWPRALCPAELPDQSTMSRRAHSKGFDDFMVRLGRRLSGRKSASLYRLLKVDGKALCVAAHSTDPNARWGRGVGQKAKGYKLHTIWAGGHVSGGHMPEQWCVTPLNVPESEMASRMIQRIEGYGYLLGDGHFDNSSLHDVARKACFQLLSPRRYKHAGLGHHYQSEHRLRSIQSLEVPWAVSRFGKKMYKQRKQIEQEYGNAGSILLSLPPWIRRIWRVRSWTWAKLLINAARKRCLHRHRAVGA